ncbi:hypothetical protein WAI453_012074 [Rhynchosporium graminicola]
MSATPHAHPLRSQVLYDVLSTASIRLLELLDSPDDADKTILRLQTYDVKETPPFNALSYVWGRSTEVREVLCRNELKPNGALTSITPNILEALPFLKAISKMPIWIDAVCINQRDRDEKARVVPIMGKIFGEAVVVML